MTINYVVKPRKNINDPYAPQRYYAMAKARGDVNLKQLGKEITQRSTVNHADTLAVLESLTQLLGEHIMAGDIVRLGDLGDFRITLSSAGTATAEEFTSAQIEKARIRFRPGQDLREVLQNLTYKKEK
ncbi:MAG: HU family DNA-binding protein [Streptococcaceae bacterium]|jgi:predicted histone-like DNA-binding protein|nr:HU family DNA-binding protein [Streptococcaceae bacterium]